MGPAPRPHELFTGPFEALEEEFLGRLDRLMDDDPLRPVEVLAGSNLLSVYLRRLAASRRGAIANLRLLTFVDLARAMTSGPDPRPELPLLAEALLARRALLEAPEATAFGPLRDRTSLAAALVRTAQDLRDARIPPHLVREAGGRTSEDCRVFLDAVGASLEALEELRSRFADSTSLLERATSTTPRPTSEPLLVYGLYDLGGLRQALLALCASARPVVAFVPDGKEPWSKSGPGPSVRRALFERLLGVDATVLSPGTAHPETLTVLAPTESSEAREVVRELLRGVADGIPLHRMAVILRDPPRQEPALVGELRLRGIPFFRPAGPGTSTSPEGRVVRALFDLAARDLPRPALEELFSFLDGLGVTSLEGEPLRPARLAAALTSLAFGGGRAALERKMAAARSRIAAWTPPADDPEGRLARRHRSEAAALDQLRSGVETVFGALPDSSPAPWDEWAGRLARSAALLLGASAGGDGMEAARDALASLSAVEGGSKAIEDVVALLPDALDSLPVREGRFERDGVALLAAVSARGLRFDLVVVPGLVEQTFPKRGLPDPLLFDAERELLARRTGAPLATRGGQRQRTEEEFLFWLTARSARRRLVLVAAERDASADRPRVLSSYLLDHLSARGEKITEGALRGEEGRRRGVRRVLLGRTEASGVALDRSEALLRALQADAGLGQRLPGEKVLARALERRRGRFAEGFTVYEGRLGRAPRIPSFLERPVSASRLEQVAACPYRAFFGSVLRLAPKEEAEGALPVLDPLTRGSLAHEALRDLARQLLEEGRSFADLSETTAHLLAQDLARRAALRWAEALGGEVAPLFVSLAAGSLEPFLHVALDRERARPDPLPVAGAELRFGGGPQEADDDPLSSAEPVPFEAGGVTWQLTGKIDRVDRGGGRLRVVDYKFGRPRPYGKGASDLDVAGGERLQLPIYALAARRLGGEEVTSEYLFVYRPPGKGGPEPVAREFDADATAGAVASLGRFLALVRSIVLTGDFAPKTHSFFDGESTCRNCDFAPLCGPGHAPLYDRKLRADGPSPLNRMKELP